ncbi:hypothetical protein GCM10022239_17380 [Leifsonia bigeumensis]|uniref:Helix-hairpin-helix DNA-binding motif class 1 domain-containing protein n=1 Tax=Leifsonella bigeumensis TaxID=433643 RepID=A0ABP7FKM3_9MICO
MPLADPLTASCTSRFRVGLGAAVVLLVVGLGIAVLVTALSANGGTTTVISAPDTGAAGTGAAAPSAEASASGVAIYVHILGAVSRPGLYQLRDGDRAIDAIAAAGGYAEGADRRQLNLARFLSDGEQIYVPREGEAGARPGGGPTSGTVGGKVNLNTADAAALETLPRVGPALAARILAWRAANGRFTSIEDLLGVSGIGEKTFAGLKDLVTI